MPTTLTLNGSETLVVQESTADRFEVLATYSPHGSKPPAHTHPHHDEQFVVVSGTLRVGYGKTATEQDYTAGDAFEIPRGTVHHMWNAGDEPAVVRWTSTPARNVAELFTAMDAAHRSGFLGRAGVLHAYRDVMRPVSPVVRAAVRLLGPLARPRRR